VYEFEILVCHFHGLATHPFHSTTGHHEVGGRAGFIVDDQISRSDRYVNVSRRAGPSLDAAAKSPIGPGPEAVAVHEATQERAFDSEKREDDE
jgi:hypothetical protein